MTDIRLVETAKPEPLPQIVQSLTHWQQDPDLAPLRGEPLIQQLPADDQQLCRTLWADHAELVKRMREMALQTGK